MKPESEKILQISVLAGFDQFFSYFDFILASYMTFMGSYNSVHLIHIRQLYIFSRIVSRNHFSKPDNRKTLFLLLLTSFLAILSSFWPVIRLLWAPTTLYT